MVRKVKKEKRTLAKGPAAGGYSSFLSMKHAWEYCYSLLDGMLVHSRVTPSNLRINATGEA